MLKGFDVTKPDSTKIRNEYGAWSVLLLDSADEMVEHLRSLKITRNAIRTLTSVRCNVLFKFETMCDIANMSVSIEDQNKHITCMENGDHNFPLSSKEKRSGLNHKIDNNEFMNYNNDQNAPHYKQIIKDVTKSEVFHVNSTNLMKNVSIKCSSSSNLLTFYQTLNTTSLNSTCLFET